jgi:hypothetical protein
MFATEKSRVAVLANAADLDGAEGYLAYAVVPTTSECAIYVAAIGAGAAISACAGYIANAWANLNKYGDIGHRFFEDDASLSIREAEDRSVSYLVDSRVDVLS